MPAQDTLDALAAQVTATVGAMQSATVFINGSQARLDAAVAKALENGATAAQLAPITDEIAAQKAATEDLTAAIAANPGPAAPVSSRRAS